MTGSEQCVSWTVHEEAETYVLELSGEIDLSNADAFGDEGARLASTMANGTRLVIDLAGVRFMDSMGLRALLRIHRRAGDALVIRNPSPQVQRLLDVTVRDVFAIECAS